MNQEKIGNLIKQIRKENNLSQEKFANKYGVSYQAVSKWENGKNLPDMLLIKEICKDFNINIEDFMNGKMTKEDNKKNQHQKKYLIIFIILVLSIIFLLFYKKTNSSYSFKEIMSDHKDFNLTGSVVHSDDRTSLIINNINYLNDSDNTIYKKLVCILYEEKENRQIVISKCEEKNNETLQNYLNNLKIKMDHNKKNCTMFINYKMFLELKLVTDNDTSISYKIPIKINDESCE